MQNSGNQRSSGTIFVIGAGFTRAVFPKDPLKAPLNADLLKQLTASAGPTSAIVRCRERYHAGDGRYYDDIEQLLTVLSLERISVEYQREENHGNKELLAELRDLEKGVKEELATYFSKFSFSENVLEDKLWIKRFAEEVLQPNDKVVSLNYDCFLEGMLDHFAIWSPKSGYRRIYNGVSDDLPENSQGILFYKIHGSENFVESGTLPDRGQTSIGYVINPRIFPRSGENRFLGGGAIAPCPYIMLPSFVKSPHIQIEAMMLDLLDAAQQANTLITIGCGMRPEDNFLRLLLARFLNKSVPRPRLVIVDPSAKGLADRISKHWVGDITRHFDLKLIPTGLAEGLAELVAFLHLPA